MNNSQHFFMWRFITNYLSPLILACNLYVKSVKYVDSGGYSCRGILRITYEDNHEKNIDVTDCDGKYKQLVIKVMMNI